jgi:hypothetical protein
MMYDWMNGLMGLKAFLGDGLARPKNGWILEKGLHCWSHKEAFVR